MRKQHPKRRISVLWLGVVLILSGCATSGNAQKEEDLARRRANSHFNLAADHADNGRPEMALRELLAASSLDPTNPRIEHALGIGYLRKGKIVETEEHLLKALELAPSYQDARYNLSTLYLNQARYAECIEHSKMLADDPTYTAPWRALTNWGWAEYQLGNLAGAREHLEYALDYNHQYWPTLLNIGILEQAEGNRDEAIAAFERVLVLRPRDSGAAEANYRLAEIYVSMGLRNEAIGHLRTAVVKAPGDSWGKKSEAYLMRLR